MHLRLDEIPPEGLDLEISLDPEDPAIKELNTEGPVTGSFHIGKIGSQVLVRGSVKGKVRFECSRCLRSFTTQVGEKVDIELRPIGSLESEGSEVELGVGDLDVEFFRGDSLDLCHLTAEQIALALPMKPLCSEDCQGICPGCGADLKQGPCQCPSTGGDPRWGALEDLKKRFDDKDR